MRFLLVLSFLMAQAYAGNGSSGGGNIYGDQINPWFMQNTTDVSYCIQISDDFSLLAKDTIQSYVAESFEFWKSKFAKEKTISDRILAPKAFVGTQNFHFSPECTTQTDLRFQFGFLSPLQKSKFSNLNQIIGMAYRESYDSVNLRGKGFIYIAPERGNLRPSSETFADRPWSTQEDKQESKLLLAIAHEVGHVFGVQDDHVASPLDELMSAHFVENITLKRYAIVQPIRHYQPLSSEAKYYHSIFMFSDMVSSPVKEFLGLPSNHNLLNVEGDGDKIYLWSSKEHSENSTKVGSFSLKLEGKKIYNQSYHTKVKLWLPQDQAVFRMPEGTSFASPYIVLYTVLNSFVIKDVIYEREDGAKLKIDCVINNGWLNINAIINGNYEMDLFTAAGGTL